MFVKRFAQKKILLTFLLFSISATAMDCLKYNKQQNGELPANIHIHNHHPVNKKGAALTVATIASLAIGMGLDFSNVFTSAPTYDIQYALPYNNTINPSLYPTYITLNNECTDHTIICSQQEIEYYNQLCQYHYSAQNHTALSKRLLRDIARIKREASARTATGPCVDACALTENSNECTDLTIRDTAVIIKKCTGSKSNYENIFGVSIGSLATRAITLILTLALGASASGCF